MLASQIAKTNALPRVSGWMNARVEVYSATRKRSTSHLSLLSRVWCGIGVYYYNLIQTGYEIDRQSSAVVVHRFAASFVNPC